MNPTTPETKLTKPQPKLLLSIPVPSDEPDDRLTIELYDDNEIRFNWEKAHLGLTESERKFYKTMLEQKASFKDWFEGRRFIGFMKSMMKDKP